MDIQHNTEIHILSEEVHDQTEDMCTLQPFTYQMLWNKYDDHMASLYFYMFHIFDVIFTRLYALRILDFIFDFFK